MKYFRPQSISEACALFEDNAATLLAGGTDLLPMYEMGRSLPDMLVDFRAWIYQVGGRWLIGNRFVGNGSRIIAR